MNKADLIEKIAKDAGINKTQADSAINSVLDGVQEALKKGESSDIGWLRHLLSRTQEGKNRTEPPNREAD